MELEAQQTTRPCRCGEYQLPVSMESAERVDAGKTDLLCSPNCWGIYLARRGNNDKGNK